MSKAYLTFGSTKTVSYVVTVIRVTQGYNVQFNNATTRKQKNSYPIRVKEADFQFTIQCRNVREYDVLKLAVKRAHDSALSTPGAGVCRFSYPALKIDYL